MQQTRAHGGTELQLALWHQYISAELQRQIHLSVSVIARPQRPLKPHVFWAHQAHDQPSVQNLADPLVQQGIDAFVFVSEWQRAQYIKYLGVSNERSYVIRNAIEPITPHRKPAGVLKLVYTSTPFRGLDVLLDAFARLPASLAVELHIYSGMGLYGRPEEDKRFAELYIKAQALPGVYYHGVVSNAEVRQALKESHIFAYPCTWEETSCIALIEAMSAGCTAVIPDLAALPETASGYAQLYPYTDDKVEHVERFAEALRRAIHEYRTPKTENGRGSQVTYFANAYSWETRSVEWVELLETIIKKHGRAI